MAKFHIFATDTFFGTHDAADAQAAMQACAEAIGTEGNTEGLTAYEDGTNDQADRAAWEARREDFIASGESRCTSREIMETIAHFARTGDEAEALWDGSGFGVVATLADICERATERGQIDPGDLFWGDRSLAQVISEGAGE